MPVKNVYRKYFQKSKVFLYPLLNIKRGSCAVPEETYLSWNEIQPEDAKLICVYDCRDDDEFMRFEKTILLRHNRLVDYIKTHDKIIYTFDFSDIKEDWLFFIGGRYSKMSLKVKEKILNFFDISSSNYVYMKSYLFPEGFYSDYAKCLDVDESILREVIELCNKPDLEKETLLLETVNLENLKILD
jgi:hypothetical protein